MAGSSLTPHKSANIFIFFSYGGSNFKRKKFLLFEWLFVCVLVDKDPQVDHIPLVCQLRAVGLEPAVLAMLC